MTRRVAAGAAIALSFALSAAIPAGAAPCGGDFGQFVQAMKAEAATAGASKAAIDNFFAGAAIDQKVLRFDSSQSIFHKSFVEFSHALVSQNRIDNAARFSKKYNAVFDRARHDYGVSRGVLLAFLAFETDFGQVQGDFNTRDALVTLAWNCRRPEVFQPQVIAAIKLSEKGEFDPATTTGAWAGEIGQVQMLPRDILLRGVDGDGDGKVSMKTSAPDAILTAAHLLQYFGWQAGQPWLQEVTVPKSMDWSLSGLDAPLPSSRWAAMGVRARQGHLADLPANLLLPQGRKGPAFLAYPNFKVLLQWNKSLIYVTTVATFADRIEGAPAYRVGNPDPILPVATLKELQRKLAARGYDMGVIDGIIGASTRRAVQAEQKRLGMPADGWPTQELVNAL